MMINREDLARQEDWSTLTFGPGRRTKGLINHITKELAEIEKDPTDLYEWIDIIILAFDGAWRAGYTPNEILQAYHVKMIANLKRSWPDWQQYSEDEAIEHIR